MQKLPSAVSRLPLPAEVEGYTMMYEPPLHTPSPPRPSNTSQTNGTGNGSGSGLEASGCVSPPPVPCLQVDAPQQEDVFRASEVRGGHRMAGCPLGLGRAFTHIRSMKC